MDLQTLEHKIEDNLRNFDRQPLKEAATTFLNTLGYHSQRVGNNDIDSDRFKRLKDAAAETAKPAQKLCINDWREFHILMQVADDEINEQRTKTRSLFQSSVMDDELLRSYIFVTMQLDGGTYTRTQLSDITRLINRQNPQIPIMVIFRYGAFLTLAIINRRERGGAQGQHVLEKVILIKDINLINKPHAAHRNILAQLSLEGLIEIEGVYNFDTLHKAWAGILDTEPLTREFYGKLYKWYQWAVDECRFPDNENELQVIRLITRLLFIWFLKEKHFEGKHLVPPDLFDEDGVEEYLNHFDPETSDYYRVVLQNLFFATLNTPIDERRFGTDGSTYHFSDLLKNPDAFLEHLKQVPFVNGGLFDYYVTQECFTDDTNEQQNLHVPTKLFFDAEDGILPIFIHYKFTVEERTPVEQEVALDPELLGQVFENLLGVYNPETKTTARRATGSYYTPRKIVEYMVDETLIAYFLQKVDPYDNDRDYLEERLRLNLEDLLAYESQGKEGETSDHLIHDDEIESLIQAINKLKILDPAVGSGAFPTDILNKLVLILQKLDPQNERWKQQQLQQASQILDSESKRKAIEAIEEVFSEENHHNDYSRKLYLIQNCIYGVDIQPFAITIAKLRFFISLVIEQKSNKASDNNYGIRALPNLETKLVAANTLVGLRKLNESETLLLLEDNMIQPLLHQILGLRVNYFDVNTPKGKQEHIEAEEELRNLLDKTLDLQYAAWCVQEQNKIKQQVSQLPTERAQQQCNEELQRKYRIREAKFKEGVAEAKRIAQWNPYDPNDTADFFEPEYMFGVKDGFDIAISNPPYIRHEKIKHLKPALRIQFEDFFTSKSKADISVYFYKRVAEFLRHGGVLTYICTNKFLRSDYGENLRQFLATNMSLEILLDLGNVPVFKAAVDTCITLMKKYFPAANHSLRALTLRRASDDFNIHDVFQKQSFPIELTNLSSDVWAVAPPDAQALLKKLRHTGDTLGKCVKLNMGLKTGRNEAFVIDADTRDRLIDANAGSDELIKPVLKGETVCKWKTKPPGEYLIVIESSANRSWPWSDANDKSEAEQIFKENYPAIFDYLNAYRKKLRNREDQGKYYWELRSCVYYNKFEKPKIVYPDIGTSMRACYDTTQVLCLQTAYILPTDDLSLLAILNSRVIDWHARYKFQSLNDPWAGGGLRFFVQYMKNIPIADQTPTQKAELSRLVERILADPESKDVPALEKQIDALVYRLYGLSKAEIALIKQTYQDAGMPL